MKKYLAVAVRGLCAVLLAFSPLAESAHAQQTIYGASPQHRVSGKFYASAYNTWKSQIISGNASTGSQSITIGVPNAGPMPGLVALSDGYTFAPFAVGDSLLVGIGANQETVTLTGASNCPPAGPVNPVAQCTLTATFANTHGAAEPIFSGSFGLQEAIDDAFSLGGGIVVIDGLWQGTNAKITSAQVYPSVTIEDTRSGVARYWNPTPTGAALAVPTTLTAQAACDATHQFCSDANVAGSASYAGGSLFGCVAYVDIMGNEGPCSLTASFTDVSAKAIDVAAPAASAGAVGYVVYLSLDAGTYAQAYQIPSTSLNCTLTTLETVLPACAVTNTTYGQSASTFGANALFNGGSQITTIAVNTGLHFTKLASVAMTAASLTPVSNSSVTYSYSPGNRVGAPGISSANVINYAASPSSATALPNAIATWTIPANYFNFIGAEFRVSGKFTFTDGGDTSTEVRVAWDAGGTNTTTVPTKLCSVVDTATGTAAAYNGTYYCSVKVATTGATGTALVDGYANLKLAAGATTLVRDSTDVAVAPSASINLATPARIVVYFIGTGATNNPGAQGLAAKLEVLN